MKSDPAVPADRLHLLRQQLILAQVRIMELEDTRDELSSRIPALEKMLAQAQALADQKSGEVLHFQRVHADLQQQFDHLRHMQHVTNQALEETRATLAVTDGREQDLLNEVELLQNLIARQAELSRDQLVQIDSLAAQLATVHEEAAARLKRVTQLESEQRALKTSRSWRWTAWLRAIERTVGNRQP